MKRSDKRLEALEKRFSPRKKEIAIIICCTDEPVEKQIEDHYLLHPEDKEAETRIVVRFHPGQQEETDLKSDKPEG